MVETNNCKIYQKEDFILIVLSSKLEKDSISQFCEEITSFLVFPQSVIINLYAVESIDGEWSQFLSQFHHFIELCGKKCQIIYSNDLKEEVSAIAKTNREIRNSLSRSLYLGINLSQQSQNEKNLSYANIVNYLFHYCYLKHAKKLPLKNKKNVHSEVQFEFDTFSFYEVKTGGFSFIVSFEFNKSDLVDLPIITDNSNYKIELINFLNDFKEHLFVVFGSTEDFKAGDTRLIETDNISEVTISKDKEKIRLKDSKQFIIPLKVNDTTEIAVGIYLPNEFTLFEKFFLKSGIYDLKDEVNLVK